MEGVLCGPQCSVGELSVGVGLTRLGVSVRARVSEGVREVLSGGQENSMETKLSLLGSRKR